MRFPFSFALTTFLILAFGTVSVLAGDDLTGKYMVFSTIYKTGSTTHVVLGQYHFTSASEVVYKYIDINPGTTSRSAVEERTGQRWLYNPHFVQNLTDLPVFEGTSENPTDLRNRLVERYGENYEDWRFEPCVTGEITRPRTSGMQEVVGTYTYNAGHTADLTVEVSNTEYYWQRLGDQWRLLNFVSSTSGTQGSEIVSIGFESERAGYLHYTKLADTYDMYLNQDNDFDGNFDLGPLDQYGSHSIPFNFHPDYGLLAYTQGAYWQTPGNYGGLYNGYNSYCRSAWVAHSFLVNQHANWPSLMSYLTSHIYDSGGPTCNATSEYGPYCYDPEEEANGHKSLLLPVYINDRIDKMVFVEVSANDGNRYPIVAWGYLQGR